MVISVKWLRLDCKQRSLVAFAGDGVQDVQRAGFGSILDHHQEFRFVQVATEGNDVLNTVNFFAKSFELHFIQVVTGVDNGVCNGIVHV